MFITLRHAGRTYVEWTREALVSEAGVPEAIVDAALAPLIVAAAHAEIDAICDAIYTASPSRDARYANKYDEAVRYRDAGYPGSVAEAEYPTLVNEAPKRAMTKRQLADTIIARRDAFNLIGGKAEAARAEVEATVTGAPAGEREQVVRAIVAAFRALANA